MIKTKHPKSHKESSKDTHDQVDINENLIPHKNTCEEHAFEYGPHHKSNIPSPEILREGRHHEMDYGRGCKHCNIGLEHERVQPGLTFDHRMNFYERQRFAYEEDSFQGCQDHVKGQEQDEGYGDEGCVLLLHEDQELVQEDAFLEDQLAQESELLQLKYIWTSQRGVKMRQMIAPMSLKMKTQGLTLAISSSNLKSSQKSRCFSNLSSNSESCVSSSWFFLLCENQPSTYSTRLRDLRTRSASLIRATVCFFSQSVMALASFVRRHLGRFLKSIIKEKGRAVMPNAPQQAKIGYPIRQSRPMRKHGTVVTISKVVSIVV